MDSLQTPSLSRTNPLSLQDPNSNDNSQPNFPVITKEILAQEPKQCVQICKELSVATSKASIDTAKEIFQWLEELYQTETLPLHHWLQCVCYYPSWIVHNQVQFRKDMDKLLQMWKDRKSRKNLRRIQKVVNVIQTNGCLAGLLPNEITVNHTSLHSYLPKIILFYESLQFRAEPTKTVDWSPYPYETFQAALQFCRTGLLESSLFEKESIAPETLWNLFLLAEDFEMENLQKACQKLFFSSLDFIAFAILQARYEDVSWCSTFLHNLPPSFFTPTTDLSPALWEHVHRKNSRTMNLSSGSTEMIVIFQNKLFTTIKERYEQGLVSQGAFLCTLLIVTSDRPCFSSISLQKIKHLFGVTVASYMEKLLKRSTLSGEKEEELQRIAFYLRYNYELLYKEYFPSEELLFFANPIPTTIPKILLYAESRWFRKQLASSCESVVTSLQLAGSRESWNSLFRFCTRISWPSAHSEESLVLVVEVYRIASLYSFDRITAECRKALQTPGIDVHFTSDKDQVGYVSISEWGEKQKAYVYAVGEHLTSLEILNEKCRVAMSQDRDELARNCPNLRTLILSFPGYTKRWTFSNLQFNAKIFPKLQSFFIFYDQEEEIRDPLPYFYPLSESHYQTYFSDGKDIASIPQLDVFLFPQKASAVDVFAYPAAAREWINFFAFTPFSLEISSLVLSGYSSISAEQRDILLQRYSIQEKSPFPSHKEDPSLENHEKRVSRKLDQKQIHYIADIHSPKLLWNMIDNHRHWDRLHTLLIKHIGIQPEEESLLQWQRLIPKCTSLNAIEIDVRDYLANAIWISELAKLPSLSQVRLISSSFTKESIQKIQSFLNTILMLHSFSIRTDGENGALDDEWIARFLGIHPKIHCLAIPNSAITDASLEAIAKCCTALQELDISSCKEITEKGVQALIDSSVSLQKLHISHCPNISSETVMRWRMEKNVDCIWDFGYCPSDPQNENSSKNYTFSPLPTLPEQDIIVELKKQSVQATHLEKLSVMGCRLITDRFLDFVSETYPNLESIDFRGCDQITDKGIQRLVEKCGKLTSIFLSNNSLITDFSVRVILEDCPSLSTLVIEYCEGITDKALKDMKKYQRPIQKLSLAGCTNITDYGVLRMARGLKICEKINMHDCQQISGAAFVSLVRFTKKHLKTLRLKGCSQIRKRDEKAISLIHPDLHVEYEDTETMVENKTIPSTGTYQTDTLYPSSLIMKSNQQGQWLLGGNTWRHQLHPFPLRNFPCPNSLSNM